MKIKQKGVATLGFAGLPWVASCLLGVVGPKMLGHFTGIGGLA